MWKTHRHFYFYPTHRIVTIVIRFSLQNCRFIAHIGIFGGVGSEFSFIITHHQPFHHIEIPIVKVVKRFCFCINLRPHTPEIFAYKNHVFSFQMTLQSENRVIIHGNIFDFCRSKNFSCCFCLYFIFAFAGYLFLWCTLWALRMATT